MSFNEDDIEEEVIKSKSKMYAITTVFIIIAIIVIIFSVWFIIKSSVNGLLHPKTRYHILDINQDNKSEIINLYIQEMNNEKYCESMYKIEYNYSFPDGKDYTMYCKDGNNIRFAIDKGGEDTLATYIEQNGYNEIR